MRRFIRTVSVVLACLAASPAVGTAAGAAQARATAGAVCSTSQTIEITSLAFNPPAVAPGGTSQAIASLQNCTPLQQQASAEWLGRWVSASGGFPSGCPAIDPLLLQVNFAPFGQATASVGYLVPPACTASALEVTVRVIQNGVVIAQRSADLVILRPTPAS